MIFPAHNHFPSIRPHSPLPSSCLCLNHFFPSSFIIPSPGSLVAHPSDSQNQLHVPALIPEPKSPGQGPSFPSCSHFTRNELQFQQFSSPSSQCGSRSCKCYTSGAHCTSCKGCREGHPCVNSYPGRSGKCANVVLSSTVILPASTPQLETVLQPNSLNSLSNNQGQD